MRIIVASTNPVKINSVLEGFKLLFPEDEIDIQGVSAPSGVSNQPMTDNETFQGALNRVNYLSTKAQADFWVGLEAGIYDHHGDLGVFGWVIVKSKDNKLGKGRSATFMLPGKIAKLIREGMELGEADDKVFGDTNSKQKQGTIGKLTGNVIDRKRMYLDAVIFALVPFKNPDLYWI